MANDAASEAGIAYSLFSSPSSQLRYTAPGGHSAHMAAQNCPCLHRCNKEPRFTVKTTHTRCPEAAWGMAVGVVAEPWRAGLSAALQHARRALRHHGITVVDVCCQIQAPWQYHSPTYYREHFATGHVVHFEDVPGSDFCSWSFRCVQQWLVRTHNISATSLQHHGLRTCVRMTKPQLAGQMHLNMNEIEK